MSTCTPGIGLRIRDDSSAGERGLGAPVAIDALAGTDLTRRCDGVSAVPPALGMGIAPDTRVVAAQATVARCVREAA